MFRIIAILMLSVYASTCIAADTTVMSATLSHYKREWGDIELRYSSAKLGDPVTIDSIIITPCFSKKGNNDAKIRIEFSRVDVSDSFINDFFYGKDTNIVNIHSFGQNGVESILTKDKLILNISYAVALHIRNDVPHFPNYKTFKSDTAIGKITEVHGDVMVSKDTETIRGKLGNIFVQYCETISVNDPGVSVSRPPDGSYRITAPGDSDNFPPKKYPPRIMK